MPCSKCNHSLVYYEKDPLCPKCESLAILDSVTATMIADRRIKHLEKLLMDYLITLDKQSLIAQVTWRREQISREFFKKYSTLDLGEFLSDTLLLKRAVLFGKKEGQKIIENEDDAKKLLEFYRDAVGAETDHLQIELGYANMMYTKKFDADDLTDDQIKDNFHIVQNERYIDLIKSYENYNLFTPEEGSKKIQKFQKEFDELMKEKPKTREFTSQEFIKTQYDTICSLYIGLLRNRLFAAAFDLREYSKILSEPHQLSEFVNTFTYGESGISACPTNEFLIKAKNHFKKKILLLKKILLFEEENPDAFPLFIRVKNDVFDSVLISHGFTAFMYILLHAIITKDLFDAETQRRAYIFEKLVKDEFKKLGFNYLPNQTDNKKKSTLEIDGIALKNKVCYVIECKKHLFPPLVEETQRRSQMVRDLKGIVDGKKYTTRNEKISVKEITSLPTKIKFVTNNLERFKLNRETKINGLIVTMDYPFINEYKSIKILSLNQISFL